VISLVLKAQIFSTPILVRYEFSNSNVPLYFSNPLGYFGVSVHPVGLSMVQVGGIFSEEPVLCDDG
jgi:hypothetical protein